MAQYNLTILKEAHNVQKLFAAADTYSGNTWMGMVVLSTFLVMFLALKRWRFDYALLASSWAHTVLCFFLVYAGLLNPLWLMLFIVMAAFSGMYVWTTDRA